MTIPRILSLLACCLLLVTRLDAQNFEWMAQTGNTLYEDPRAVCVDTAGNVISVGYFQGVMDADPGAGVLNLTSNGAQDIFIQKLNPAGQLLWAKKIGGNDFDVAADVVANEMGEIYVTGTYTNTVDFDPGFSTHLETTDGNNSGFLLKLMPNGGFLWVAVFGGPGSYGQGRKVALDDLEYPVVTGIWGGTVDFDPNLGTQTSTLPSNAQNTFVAKLASNFGVYQWHRVWAGNPSMYPNGLDVDPSGNVLLTGYYQGNTDLDPGTGSFTLTDGGTDADFYVLKLNSGGNFLWVKGFGGSTGGGVPTALRTDPWGNIAVTGWFVNAVDFDPGTGTVNRTSSGGGQDIFVLRLGADGTFRWVAVMAGTVSQDRGLAMDIDILGNIYSTGFFVGTVDFDPGVGVFNLVSPPVIPISSAYIQKLDSAGNYEWAGALGGTNGASLTGVSIDVSKDKSIHILGPFTGEVDFDPGVGIQNRTSLPGALQYDMYLVKLSQCTGLNTASSLTASACFSYELNGQTYSNTGTFTQTIANHLGCDSTITLNLTIRQPTFGTLSTTQCGPYTINGQTYTSSGTYAQTLTNVNGCDSTLTISLLINQNTTATTSATACGAYFWPVNGQTYTTSGPKTATLTNSQGCDSLITLNLTINQSTAATLTQSACTSYTLNGQTYTSAGTYTQALTNAAGCDSTLTLVLTLTPVSASLTSNGGTLTASPSGLTYQWIDCGNGNSPVSGATALSFTPTTSGSYAVIVTDGPCADTSACETVVGVEECSFCAGLQVFPNPFENRVTLQLPEVIEGLELQLYDAQGKRIRRMTVVAMTNEIDLSALARGVYFMRLTANGQQKVFQLVKE
jgi:hypothetical protein